MRFADDSEKGFYDSDEDSEEDYSQEEEIDFVDLAARPSAVRAEVSAKKMLKPRARSSDLTASAFIAIRSKKL
jgi:hypothetical protein